MKLKYFIFSLVIPFFPTAFAFAWSATGHGIVGDIAYKHLSPLAQSRVAYYLKGRSVHLACTWMDSVKSIRAYSYLTQRHYLNLDKGVTYDTTSTNDVVFELKRVIEQLSNRGNLSDSLITQYVLEVFHLVGDIHQPLHCGYGSDNGGNSVNLTFLGQSTELHAVWDNSIIQSAKVSVASVIAAYPYTPEEIQQIQQINVLEWMNESVQLVDTCYYPEKNNVLDSDYVKTRLPVVQQRLYQAGLRLAAVLEMLFGDSSTLPVNLLSFDVQSSNQTNTLFWETSNSNMVVRFIVEASKDGINFNTAGTVESNGLKEANSYHFEDAQTNSNVYYRLKMELNDGSTQYSSVVKASWGSAEKFVINISPNPAKSFLNVQFDERISNTVTIKLLGLDGKVFRVQQYPLTTGNVTVNFDLTGLAKGVYILYVEGLGMKKVVVE